MGELTARGAIRANREREPVRPSLLDLPRVEEAT